MAKTRKNKKNKRSVIARQNFRSLPSRTSKRGIPAVSAATFKSWIRMSSSGDKVIVAGADLVYSTPQQLSTTTGTLFAAIPCNPCYWTGTRISQIAPSYLYYRPRKLMFHYIPQVAVTQSGTVIMGTLWGTAVEGDRIQQSLTSSNGGLMVQCYKEATSNVLLGASLPFNLFECNGSLADSQVNPFMFYALATGASDVAPGYFIVTYEYELKNAIGSAKLFNSTFNSGGVARNGAITWGIQLITAITLRALKNAAVCILREVSDVLDATVVGVGKMFTVPTDAGQRYARNSNFVELIDESGTVVHVPADTPVFLYENGNPNKTTQPTPPQGGGWPYPIDATIKTGNDTWDFVITEDGNSNVTVGGIDVTVTAGGTETSRVLDITYTRSSGGGNLDCTFTVGSSYVNAVVPAATSGSGYHTQITLGRPATG